MAITGASSGIGAALAETFAARGVSRLSLTARRGDKLAEVAQACADRAAAQGRPAPEIGWRPLDITDRLAVRAWVEEVDASVPIDLAISNAGVLHGAQRAGEIEDEALAVEQIDVNLTAAVCFLTAVARLQCARGRGRLVAVSSLAGLQPIADELAYSASKAGLNAFCEGLRDFVEPFGVGVTLACPGFIRTPMGDGFKGPRPMEISAEAAARRIADAAERGRDFTAFPSWIALGARLGRFAPRALRRPFTERLRFRFPPSS